jgi:hypothetical protein
VDKDDRDKLPRIFPYRLNPVAVSRSLLPLHLNRIEVGGLAYVVHEVSEHNLCANAGIPTAKAGNNRSRSDLSDSALLHAHIWRVAQGGEMFHRKIEQHWR